MIASSSFDEILQTAGVLSVSKNIKNFFNL